MVSQQDIDVFLRKSTAKMVEYLRVRYSTPSFSPVVKVTFSQRSKRSRGGTRGGYSFINIVAHRFLTGANTSAGTMNGLEYKSFNADPVIGGMYNVSWKVALASLIAHELGHAVQYDRKINESAKVCFGLENTAIDSPVLRGHNWFWRKIYADLRIQFVNGSAFSLNLCGEESTEVKSVVKEPVKPVEEVKLTAPGKLFVKYRYKGASTHSEFYIDNKLVVVIVEMNHRFYKKDPLGDEMELLPFASLVEARKNLIGQ